MFEQVRLLYDNSLWSSLVQIAPYALSHEIDCEGKSGKKRHLLLCMIGDAFFEQRNFKKAEPMYKEAIQLKKQIKIRSHIHIPKMNPCILVIFAT